MTSTLHLGDAREVLATLPAESVDAVVTDPPYELGFMGKAWDASGIASSVPLWREVLRVLKPGGHLLSFGGTRTCHRMTCAIEDAGFEVRDCIAWMYGTGFPKSKNAGGGRGTALKPAFEPVVLARKPLPGTVAANVAEHGTGALNIDACRIGTDTISTHGAGDKYARLKTGESDGAGEYREHVGRWPANVTLDEESARLLDAQSGTLRSGARAGARSQTSGTGYGSVQLGGACPASEGGASRFFYVAKASRSERGEGNTHPTVKPVALMRWLCRLVTPPGGTVLDPFMGSGTTGLAAQAEGLRFVGIEREAEYLSIAQRRLERQGEAA